MRSERIEGFGSVRAGEYDSVAVDGVGKIKGPVITKQLDASGLFKVKGRLVAGLMKVDGFARAFRNIRVDQIEISGLMKLRRADLEAETLTCDGMLVSNGEINADQATIQGACSLATLVGDKVTIGHDGDAEHMPRMIINGKPASLSTFRFLKTFARLYMGRKISASHSLVDTLECTELTARRLVSKLVRANRVTLRDNCRIDKLYCDGPIDMDDTCTVDEIITDRPCITQPQKEADPMANATLVKILEAYKSGRIDADEAERMIASLHVGADISTLGSADVPEVSWPDDNKLRIVAFLGRRLFRRGQPELKTLKVEFQGPAKDVECWGNLTCQDVEGDVKAEGMVSCRDVDGDVKAGGNVNCGDVEGDVKAGGNVNCGQINGTVSADGHITGN